MSRDFARLLRTDATDHERCLWHRLRKRKLGGYRFRRQAPIGDYIVDFVCYERRLIVELYGAFHNQQREKDAARTAWLESRGYRVLRYWNSEVLEGIWNALRAGKSEAGSASQNSAPGDID